MSWLLQLFRSGLTGKRVRSIGRPPSVVLTTQCQRELRHCLAPEIQKGHEGVAYLFGLTSDGVTLAVTAYRPDVETSPGSFRVAAASMAQVVRSAAKNHLSVVGQVHTHPSIAYHSEGDFQGMHIKFPGFVSIVLPDYGVNLPTFANADVVFFTSTDKWQLIAVENLAIV